MANADTFATKTGACVPKVDTPTISNNKTSLQEAVTPTTHEEYSRIVESGKAYLVNNAGSRFWCNRPVMQNPLENPKMYMLGAPISEVFNLSEKDDLAKYNALYARTSPADAPGIVVHTDDRQFYEGKFICLVSYSEVWYRCGN